MQASNRPVGHCTVLNGIGRLWNSVVSAFDCFTLSLVLEFWITSYFLDRFWCGLRRIIRRKVIYNWSLVVVALCRRIIFKKISENSSFVKFHAGWTFGQWLWGKIKWCSNLSKITTSHRFSICFRAIFERVW